MISPEAKQLFATPMPYKVIWKRPDGCEASAVSFDRDVADAIFTEQLAAGTEPTMWLGGMVVASCDEELVAL